MARTEVVRHVAADPASLALLLSGPAARELWPDADRESMHLRTPMRSGVGFVVDLSVDDIVVGPVRARLTIDPADGATTSLRLTATAPSGTDATTRDRVARFLDALARQAQSRSSAA